MSVEWGNPTEFDLCEAGVARAAVKEYKALTVCLGGSKPLEIQYVGFSSARASDKYV